MLSDGNDARYTRAPRCPARASSIASGAPAHRAPTTTTSYTGLVACGLADGLAGGQGLDVRGAQRVAGDAPVAAFHFLDDHPGDLAHVLAFDLHHGVGQPAHHVLLLLGGEDPLDD